MEPVTEFLYLEGLTTEDGQRTKDRKREISLASAMFGRFNRMSKTISISTVTNMELCRAFVTPVLMHGSECWAYERKTKAES